MLDIIMVVVMLSRKEEPNLLIGAGILSDQTELEVGYTHGENANLIRAGSTLLLRNGYYSFERRFKVRNALIDKREFHLRPA